MPSRFDFDPHETDLHVGIEVEYPAAPTMSNRLVQRGEDSNYILDSIDNWPSNIGGRAVYDGTVGLEVVSHTMPLADANNWYRDTIDYLESHYDPYEPTGLMSNGSTAGMHVHVSELEREQAQQLADLSAEPWMQVLFCSSIASEDGVPDIPVFRGGRYCDLQFGTGHYNVVNDRGGGHYEWRLPEPCLPDHIEILTTFLGLFDQDPEMAIEYAQEVLDDADDRITSLRRAEAMGLDLDDQPRVAREPAEADPEEFYQTVAEDWALPEIYTVELDGQEFYSLNTDRSWFQTLEAAGVEFDPDAVIYADTLEEVNNQEVLNEVERAIHRRQEARRETEATDELKKLVKKKK